MKGICFFCALLLASCTLLQNNQVLYRQSKTLPDTAFVYALPYAAGTSHCVWQGYYSLFSHYGNFALDFKMPQGTGVCAARGGVVVYVKESATRGGVGKRYVGTENGITIRHSDSTFAHYLHLRHNGALVNVGDTVRQGQLIGYSGSTGFSAFPHLHFEVTRNFKKATNEVPVRFHTQEGNKFLQPLHCYKAL